VEIFNCWYPTRYLFSIKMIQFCLLIFVFIEAFHGREFTVIEWFVIIDLLRVTFSCQVTIFLILLIWAPLANLTSYLFLDGHSNSFCKTITLSASPLSIANAAYSLMSVIGMEICLTIQQSDICADISVFTRKFADGFC